MTTTQSVLCFGEVLWDLLPSGPVLGGAPANLAFRVASLGNPVALISRVGRDPLGDAARRGLRALGLDDALVQEDSRHATGTVPVTFDASGRHDFAILQDVAYDYIEANSDAVAAAAGAAALCFGTLAQRSPVSRATLEALVQATRAPWVVCDVNLRRDCYTEETLRWSAAHANVIKLNDEEVGELARLVDAPRDPDGFARAAVSFWNLRACVVTLGERGSVAATRDGTLVHEPGFAVDVRDTIGSGDAFTAAFVTTLMQGRPLRDAVRRGNALGALVASQHGATEPVRPDRIDALLAQLDAR